MRHTSQAGGRKSWARTGLGALAGWAYYHCERYVWHERDLTEDQPAVPLPDGVMLRPAVAADVPALVRVEMPMLERFDEFTARGGELCIVESTVGVLAALWIFRSQMPLYPWFDLPEGVAAIEHGVTAAEERGRGLMPAVLDTVAHDLRDEGHRCVVLKILDTNRSSLKTVGKVGFRPVALMHQVKILGTHRTIVEPASGFGRHLALRLAGSRP